MYSVSSGAHRNSKVLNRPTTFLAIEHVSILLLRENQVWNLMDPPEGSKPIECKWIFKSKTNADSNVTVYKARLVAKGFRQIQGIDYEETFSPVAMLKSV